jgi:hypoxanthine phosphoribosyltransferase
MTLGSNRFEEYMSEVEISALVDRLASEIRKDYAGKTIFLIGVLKGAYAFTADLMRALKTDIEIDFVRYFARYSRKACADCRRVNRHR